MFLQLFDCLGATKVFRRNCIHKTSIGALRPEKGTHPPVAGVRGQGARLCRDNPRYPATDSVYLFPLEGETTLRLLEPMKAINIAPMKASFSAYNAGEESLLDFAFSLHALYNESVGLNDGVSEQHILKEMVVRLIRGRVSGELFLSEAHKSTHQINFFRIGEALIHPEAMGWDIASVKTAIAAAYRQEFGEKFNSGHLGRLGQKDKTKTKAKPTFKSATKSTEGLTEKVKGIKVTKSNAEDLAALIIAHRELGKAIKAQQAA